MNSVISADIGTTAAKVSLIERSGNILYTSVHSYGLISENGRMEQDPFLWWQAFREGIKDIFLHHAEAVPDALVLSGQMQDLIRISSGEVLGNAILYSDTRARDEYIQFGRDMGEDFLVDTTENLSDPSSLPCKILWLKNNIPGWRTDNGIKILLGAHDYICWKLTGRYVTDYTTGSSTGLMNFKTNQWDSDILKYLEVSVENLPELSPAGEISGTVTSQAARETGLFEGLPVIHGSGDAGASTIGAGAGVEGVVSCYLGTSGWIAITGKHPVDPCSGIYNLRHPDPERVINIGPMLMTGGNVEWTVDTFLRERNNSLRDDDFDSFTRKAGKAVPGSGGVFYLPYLSGERSPFHDPDARGAFIGMGKDTGQAEMFRAVLEGISYSLKSILDTIPAVNKSSRQLYLSGGGARSQLWAQIIASITGCAVGIPSGARETGILGNTVIAGKALGWFDSYKMPSGFINMDREYLPDEGLRSFYASGMEIFNELYPALKESFRKISKWLRS